MYGLRQLYRRGAGAAAWASGAAGERRTAALLRPLARRGWRLLHDLSIPGSAANIDHLAIGLSGVAVIDSKNWQSKRSAVTVQQGTLWYGRYPQEKMLRTVRWEAERASRALGVPVTPIVAVHGAAVPGKRLDIEGVIVVSAKRLRRTLRQLPPTAGWNAARVDATAALAAQQLPPAR
ncbi:nuclease-related domain-containing protein [Streptomyces antimycoticus]|uniref:nuclease-related domain-containing protein n=1 Tax=Streptomyces antimycoticus TaxID=68175 RepID=UPI0037CD0E1A